MDNIEIQLIQSLTEQKESLEKQLRDLKKEYNRKSYIASGLAFLVVQSNDAELISKLAKIEQEADKASEEVLVSNQ